MLDKILNKCTMILSYKLIFRHLNRIYNILKGHILKYIMIDNLDFYVYCSVFKNRLINFNITICNIWCYFYHCKVIECMNSDCFTNYSNFIKSAMLLVQWHFFIQFTFTYHNAKEILHKHMLWKNTDLIYIYMVSM